MDIRERVFTMLYRRAQTPASLPWHREETPALLKAAVLHLDGRGGGRGNLAQGGGERVERLEDALAQARASLGAAR